MPKTVVYTCSNCGTTRDASKNKWMLGEGDDDLYSVQPWDDRHADNSLVDHICSDRCLLTLIHKHIHPTAQDKAEQAKPDVTDFADYYKHADKPEGIPEHQLPPIDKVLRLNQRHDQETNNQ